MWGVRGTWGNSSFRTGQTGVASATSMRGDCSVVSEPQAFCLKEQLLPLSKVGWQKRLRKGRWPCTGLGRTCNNESATLVTGPVIRVGVR